MCITQTNEFNKSINQFITNQKTKIQLEINSLVLRLAISGDPFTGCNKPKASFLFNSCVNAQCNNKATTNTPKVLKMEPEYRRYSIK
ncbi:hypothetical protein CS542_06920 [Pedobacter sp. IW39]|nr:hypothetical protein CS542_06920 [Pedobacter sp. IW39]